MPFLRGLPAAASIDGITLHVPVAGFAAIVAPLTRSPAKTAPKRFTATWLLPRIFPGHYSVYEFASRDNLLTIEGEGGTISTPAIPPPVQQFELPCGRVNP
ncbi:MAG: hypothetical protein AAF299_20450, partial [Pseudomonadota bacterium]